MNKPVPASPAQISDEQFYAEPPRVEGKHRFMAGTCVDCGHPLDGICSANLGREPVEAVSTTPELEECPECGLESEDCKCHGRKASATTDPYAGMSIEQRIAVRAQLMRAGIDLGFEPKVSTPLPQQEHIETGCTCSRGFANKSCTIHAPTALPQQEPNPESLSPDFDTWDTDPPALPQQEEPAIWVDCPDSQGYWWHWDGDMEHVPFIYSVLTSLSRKINREFIAFPDSRWCIDVGGKWMKIETPKVPK